MDQFASRAHALRQVSARSSLLPAISRRNRAMMARVAAEALAVSKLEVCIRNMCRGSKLEVPRPPRSGGPRGFNALFGNVAGVSVLGFVKNSDGGIPPHIRASLTGTALSCGELHMFLPSDARPWRRGVDGYFVARELLPSRKGEAAWVALRNQRRAGGQEWLEAGVVTTQFASVAERPVRPYGGGVGGDRFLGLRLTPAPQSLWLGVHAPMVGAAGAGRWIWRACVVRVRGTCPAAPRPRPRVVI